MSDIDTDRLDDLEGQEEGAEEALVPLTLDVQIDEPSACQRHVVVKISREDVDRYSETVLGEIVTDAAVPGFRPGKAPKKLVSAKFRDKIDEQVKARLLMDSMQQVSESHQLSAISEPDIDLEAVTVPDEGPLTFEFNIEVRPDFELPEWRGLKLRRPVREITDEQIDSYQRRVLGPYGKSRDVDGPAEMGDTLNLEVACRRNGELVSQFREDGVKLRPILSFPEVEFKQFGELLVGKQAGDRVSTKTTIGEESTREELRGAELDVEFGILAVSREDLPKLTPSFLDELGGFEDEVDLRDTIRKEVERQANYHQQREIRQQITGQLTSGANWDLPPSLLRRQSGRELDRMVLELQASGFSSDQIRAHANELKRNVLQNTARALKEHFIFERIAEDEKIDAEPADYDTEIRLIADQRNEPARRVRARLEKRGQMDTLRNQIIERKVIEKITAEAQFEDYADSIPPENTAAIARGLVEQADIPEALHSEARELRSPTERG